MESLTCMRFWASARQTLRALCGPADRQTIFIFHVTMVSAQTLDEAVLIVYAYLCVCFEGAGCQEPSHFGVCKSHSCSLAEIQQRQRNKRLTLSSSEVLEHTCRRPTSAKLENQQRNTAVQESSLYPRKNRLKIDAHHSFRHAELPGGDKLTRQPLGRALCTQVY